MSASETEEVTRTVELPFRTYNTCKIALNTARDETGDEKFDAALTDLVARWNDANEKRRNVGDETLAKLFGYAWVTQGEDGVERFTQRFCDAGFDEHVVKTALEYARDEYFEGDSDDA